MFFVGCLLFCVCVYVSCRPNITGPTSVTGSLSLFRKLWVQLFRMRSSLRCVLCHFGTRLLLPASASILRSEYLDAHTHTHRVAGEAWRRCDAHQATRVITDQALIVAVCAAVFLAGHSSLLPSLMCVGVICVRVPWIPCWMTNTVWYCCFQTANEQTKKQATLATRLLWILLSVCLVYVSTFCCFCFLARRITHFYLLFLSSLYMWFHHF